MIQSEERRCPTLILTEPQHSVATYIEEQEPRKKEEEWPSRQKENQKTELARRARGRERAVEGLTGGEVVNSERVGN